MDFYQEAAEKTKERSATITQSSVATGRGGAMTNDKGRRADIQIDSDSDELSLGFIGKSGSYFCHISLEQALELADEIRREVGFVKRLEKLPIGKKRDAVVQRFYDAKWRKRFKKQPKKRKTR
jgi:hypothetical protein